MAGPKTKKVTSLPSQDEQMGEVRATLNYLKEDFGFMREEIQSMKEILGINSQTLAVNTEQLKVHIEGVKLAREQNDLLKKDLEAKMDLLKLDFDDKVEPIQTHVTKVQTYSKMAAWIAGAIIVPSAGYGLTKLIEFIFEKISQ